MLNKNLTEAIDLNIEGTSLIGTDKGINVYRASTPEAAGQFKVLGKRVSALQYYTQNTDTFNQYIDDTHRLYLFTKENSDEAIGAISTGYGDGSIQFCLKPSSEVATHILNLNCMFEGTSSVNNQIKELLPLHLIPELRLSKGEVIDNIWITDEHNSAILLSTILSDTTITQTHYTEIKIPESIKSIQPNAFIGDITFDKLVINESIFNNLDLLLDILPLNMYKSQPQDFKFCFTFDLEDIKDKLRDADRNDLLSELAGYHADNKIIYNYGLSDAEIQRRKELRDLKKKSSLYFKEEGKNITILGCRKDIINLEIPEEINGKPVTKIASYAFFEHPKLKTVKLPKTMKLIERGAFADTLLDVIQGPKDCVISRNNILRNGRSLSDKYITY